MRTTRDRGGHASETDAMKAKPRLAYEAKPAKSGPEADAETKALKRKPPPDATDALKAKGDTESPLTKERLALSETVALKEKLAAAGS